MNVYFVRHGETEFNASRIHQHHLVDISEVGMKQAEIVGKRFANIPVDIVLASDSPRTKSTADIVDKYLGKEVQLSELLREIKWPDEIIGKDRNAGEVIKIKELLKRNYSNPNWHYSNEENFNDLKKRAEEFIKNLTSLKYENILVITHSKILKVIIASLMLGDSLTGELFSKMEDFLATKNTGITWCKRDNEGKWEMLTWNDHAHLG